jgi:DNA-binding transcriptional MerR regulator
VSGDATGGPHLSIGEVLAELRDEFPDITISKIRFLESQGLVDPERTPSGYRKFYDQDLARLRWILHQQKAHFLPLKVIKERLDQLGPGDELPPSLPAAADESGAAETAASVPIEAREQVEVTVPPAPARVRAAARPRPPTFAPTLPIDDTDDDGSDGTSGDEHYSRGELAGAAGLEAGQVEQLESFGLITPALEVGGEARYNSESLEVARAAAGFFARGDETEVAIEILLLELVGEARVAHDRGGPGAGLGVLPERLAGVGALDDAGQPVLAGEPDVPRQPIGAVELPAVAADRPVQDEPLGGLGKRAANAVATEQPTPRTNAFLIPR